MKKKYILSIHGYTNKWDFFAIFFILSMIIILAWGCSTLGGSIDYSNLNTLKQYQEISTSLWCLPKYTANTIIRMFIALFFSLIFSFIFGLLAAKNKSAESIIIPMIDVLQSIPILGFLAITITGFLSIFPYSLWGAQLAVIFCLFTAQTWNITLSFYQSLKNIPQELKEVCDMYQLSSWQRFCKLEIPFSIPSLIWNAMMSMSASWFMIVASESIVVNVSKNISTTINLPGIGTFINQANNEQDFFSVFIAIIVMLIVIIIYDKVIFKTLVKWSEKFIITEFPEDITNDSWFFTILQRSLICRNIIKVFKNTIYFMINISSCLKKKRTMHYASPKNKQYNNYFLQNVFGKLLIITSMIIFFYLTYYYLYDNNITLNETIKVFGYGLLTALRVFTLMIISIIWLPIGIWIGLNPKIAMKVQTYAQILAAFPVNIFYGLFDTIVITCNLNFNIWCILLMSLGTQWYILFNVIAGASSIPKELIMVAKNLNLKGRLKWFKFLIPAVMPFYVTGLITAAGGAWNASIVCEYINWGKDSIIMASGIGSYISYQYHISGDHTKNIALGVIVMCILVILTNKIFWRNIYKYVEKRFSIHM